MQAIIIYVTQTVSLIRKEMLAILKDPASRALLFAPALMQALLFGYGATYDLTNAPYAVLNQSGGAASREILARIDGTGVFQRIATLTGSEQIAEQIDSGNALLVITFQSDFEAKLAASEAAPVQVIFDGRNSSTAGAASAQISAIIASYNASLGVSSPLVIMRRAWFNPNYESRWNLMPALIASLSLLQTLMLAALSVAREREQGTFDQLLVTPMTPLQILIGKALPSILVGLIQSTIIFLIILFWFGIPISGPVWLLYLGLVTFTTAAVGIGLSISAISLTMQQAMLYTFMTIMPLMLLSGLLTPVRNMPQILQAVTFVNPLRFGIDIVRRVYLEGATFQDVALSFIPLLCIAAVTLPLAAWLFRNRLG
ncbi:ABC transporter permease [Paracoccus sp. SCSIO 75233]|uniref:ABC transporter permease n=1 Tax=Paracoccus sp. SCSIO 75233 TaxID=3017782 RepID=UPI0022F0FC3A|nr:ABC transporter permease [Paracoccus sp. SCSIO 75233]WBU53020.1 ABC transporter permease [Paracoccus sp. SCSIO 75233]